MEEQVIWTNLNSQRVGTFGLTEEQHDLVVSQMVKDGVVIRSTYGNYGLVDADDDVVDTWIENEEDNAEFLKYAREINADIYTFTDSIGDFTQPIGDVAVAG